MVIIIHAELHLGVAGMFLFVFVHWAHGIEDTNTQVDVYNYLFNPSIVRTPLQRNVI